MGRVGLENLQWSLSLASMLTTLPPDNFGEEGLGVSNLATASPSPLCSLDRCLPHTVFYFPVWEWPACVFPGGHHWPVHLRRGHHLLGEDLPLVLW